MKRKYTLIAIVIFITCGKAQSQNQIWKYPVIKATPAIDNYFGKEVVDDYRGLENLDDIEVKNWFSEENKFYKDVINNISSKDTLRSEIKVFKSLAVGGDVSIPRVSNDILFSKRRNIQERSTQLICKNLKTNVEIILFSTASLIDANKSKYKIDYFEPSFDKKFVAVGVSSNGSEMSTLYVINVDQKKLLKDSIPRCMYGNPNWLPDCSGFFYNQLRELKDDKDKLGIYENSVVKLHKVAESPNRDIEVFSRRLQKDLELEAIDFPYLLTFPTSNKVLAVVYRGTNIYCLSYYASLNDVLSNPATTHWLNISGIEDKVTAHSLFGDDLFLLNFKDNSYGKVNLMKLNEPSNKTIFESHDLVLQEIIQNQNYIYLKYLKNGVNGLIELDPKSLKETDVKLPLKGSITLSTDGRSYVHSNFLYVGLDSWTKEYGIYEFKNGKFLLTDIKPQSKTSTSINLVSKEVLVKSYDGTLVPLSIVYSKDLELNGKNYTILDGYGAYGTSVTPFYNFSKLAWFKRGGIYAYAHVRGGGENGDKWYKGGYKSTKSNSWKDFIACAEYLIDNKYTSSKNLAAQTGSAGAIAIGRAITEKPNLFKAAVIKVGDLNSIRSENSKNNFGIPEFGTVKDSIEFQSLYDMDVYHHIKEGVQYPSVLFTAGMNDARVDPWQPAKAVAKMQRAIKDENIFLFRISDQGHSGDAEEPIEIYAFLFWQLGHPDFKYNKK